MSDQRGEYPYFKFQVPPYGAKWGKLGAFLIGLRNGKRGDLTYFLREAAAFAQRALGDAPLDQLEVRLNALLDPSVSPPPADPGPSQEPVQAPNNAPRQDQEEERLPDAPTAATDAAPPAAPPPAATLNGAEENADDGSEAPDDPQDTLRGYFQ